MSALYIGIIVERDYLTTVVSCGGDYAMIETETKTVANRMRADGCDVIHFVVHEVALSIYGEGDV